LVGDDGGVDVRLVYDHRVLDGGTVARALVRFEEILNTTIRDELLDSPLRRTTSEPVPSAAFALPSKAR
jgi:hypothetical protein